MMEPRDNLTIACRACDVQFDVPWLVHVLRCMHWEEFRVILFHNPKNQTKPYTVKLFRDDVGLESTSFDSLTDALDEFDATAARLVLPPFPSTTKSCAGCSEGWTCEEHPRLPFPHDDCAGPGMPCLDGCLGVHS